MSSNTKLFNNISPIYGRFFNFQVGYYSIIIDRISGEFDISKYESALDVGCGTGALSNVLSQVGLRVTGLDPSSGMLKQAIKRVDNKNIEFLHIIPGEKLPFPDKSFDIVISSYVAHGLKPEDRINLYKEMQRVSKEYVILHDYNGNRGLVTTIIEWLEGGDYFNFIKVARDELGDIFEEVRVIDVDTRAAWYICK
ncbi:class I SAM-dependent methyltransferase [Tissierella creatinini]|nr:class I SAM-dependent methyltransferase [Tissierella creatinini]TJX60850.1 class I SAM-dependent methyltransferase [Soehngenia saccharolytica]